jgi:hypothetical protein
MTLKRVWAKTWQKKFYTLFNNILQLAQDRLAYWEAQKLQFTPERLKTSSGTPTS